MSKQCPVCGDPICGCSIHASSDVLHICTSCSRDIGHRVRLISIDRANPETRGGVVDQFTLRRIDAFLEATHEPVPPNP